MIQNAPLHLAPSDCRLAKNRHFCRFQTRCGIRSLCRVVSDSASLRLARDMSQVSGSAAGMLILKRVDLWYSL